MSALLPWQRRARLIAWRWRRIGAAGLGGLLLLAAAALAVWAAPLLEREAGGLRSDYEAEIARRNAGMRALPPDAATQVTQFRAWFPTSARSIEDLRTLFRIARQQRIDLARGDYTTARNPDARLTTVDVVLPLQAGYGGVRAFIAAVLNELPHASLADLRMERATGGETLETRVHLTLFYREE